MFSVLTNKNSILLIVIIYLTIVQCNGQDIYNLQERLYQSLSEFKQNNYSIDQNILSDLYSYTDKHTICADSFFTIKMKEKLSDILDDCIISSDFKECYWDAIRICTNFCDENIVSKIREIYYKHYFDDFEKDKLINYLTKMRDAEAISAFVKKNKKSNSEDYYKSLSDIHSYYYCEDGIKMISEFIKSRKYRVKCYVHDNNSAISWDTIPNDVDNIPWLDAIVKEEYIDSDSTIQGHTLDTTFVMVNAFRYLSSITNPNFWIYIGLPNSKLVNFTSDLEIRKFLSLNKRKKIRKWIKDNYGNYQLDENDYWWLW